MESNLRNNSATEIEDYFINFGGFTSALQLQAKATVESLKKLVLLNMIKNHTMLMVNQSADGLKALVISQTCLEHLGTEEIEKIIERRFKSILINVMKEM